MILASAQTVTGAKTFNSGSLIIGAHSATAGSAAKMTSGTLMTTPEAGALEYDGVNFYRTGDTTGGRGVAAIEQYFYLNADGTAITFAGGIANFFGANSNISLVANAYYDIEINAYYLNTTLGVVTWTLTNSAAPTSQNIHLRYSLGTGTTTNSAGYLDSDYSADATAAKTFPTPSLSDAVKNWMNVRLWLKNSTGTSLKIQVTKASGGSITPLLGSYWKARRLPATNTGTFAA